MNVKGQEFIGYKMLIGAIVALFILMIIIGAINYFSTLREDISDQVVINGLEAAANSPNGDVIKRSDVTLHEGSYSARSFSKATGVEEECIYLSSINTSSFYKDIVFNAIVVNESVLADIYFRCNTGSICTSGCEICCDVSFGGPIQ